MSRFGMKVYSYCRCLLPTVLNRRGTTLIELMIASLIGIIVVASAFEIYLTQHRNWVIQDEITDAQQSARVTVKKLSQHIRMAGYGLPNGLDAIVASDTDPDTITVIYQPPGGCQVALTEDMGGPSDHLKCEGKDLSCFEENGWAYIYDPDADSGEYLIVSMVDEGNEEIRHETSPLSRAYPMGSSILMIEAHRFYVGRSDSMHPMLMIQKIGEQPEPYADNVEDLQFRYVMQNDDTLDVPNIPELVRRVLITVTARTDQTDRQFEGEYRRRDFATEVQVRNLGF